MGSKKTTVNTSSGTQTVAPPSWTMPGILDASQRVIGAMNSLPGDKYTGDFLAPPDQAAIDQARGIYQNMAGQASDLAGYVRQNLPTVGQPITYDGPNLPTGSYNIGSGQDLNPVIDAALRPVFTQLTEQALPGIKSSALDAGAYSNSRVGTLQGQALRDYSQAATDTASRIAYQDYADREARRLQAYGIDTQAALEGYQAATQRGLGEGNLNLERANSLPALTDTIMRLGTAGGDLITQQEALRQQAAQQVINNNLARNQYEWQYPFQGLDTATELLARLSGNYGTTSTQGTSKTVEKTGGLGPIVQGALGAASLAAGLGAFGPIGGLAGAAGGLGSTGATGLGMSLMPGGLSQMFRPATLR